MIAGPNGSGKSSITSKLEFEGKDHLLDLDAIARRIDPADPIQAGREAIRRTRAYLEEHRSFAIEGTLSGAVRWQPSRTLAPVVMRSTLYTSV